MVLTLLGGWAQTPATQGIVYSEPDGKPLTLDYYMPAAGKSPHPIAILVQNDDSDCCTALLASAGYATFRPRTRRPYPAALDDVTAAVRYLRANAFRFQASPYKIALIGGPGCGYLSNMTGIRLSDPSTKIHAVVTLGGPSDLRPLASRPGTRAFLASLIAQRGEHDALAEASPILRITSTTTPFLLIHGEKDDNIPAEHSVRLQTALRGRGIPCDLLLIPGGSHSPSEWPAQPDWGTAMISWLNRTLHYGGGSAQQTTSSLP